jgi:nitrogen fixation protein NifU and related proteins
MASMYSKKVMEHFQNPKNVLENEDTYPDDGKGIVGNEKCGDMMLVAIKVDKETETILDCKWKTYGCASAIASTSVLSEMTIGKTLEEARKLGPKEILSELMGLPAHKVHCSVIGDKALRAAINDYYKRLGLREKMQIENEEVVCTCLNVTREEIEMEVFEGCKTFEELQEKTKIATGCGNCKEAAEALFAEYLKRFKELKTT